MKLIKNIGNHTLVLVLLAVSPILVVAENNSHISTCRDNNYAVKIHVDKAIEVPIQIPAGNPIVFQFTASLSTGEQCLLQVEAYGNLSHKAISMRATQLKCGHESKSVSGVITQSDGGLVAAMPKNIQTSKPSLVALPDNDLLACLKNLGE